MEKHYNQAMMAGSVIGARDAMSQKSPPGLLALLSEQLDTTEYLDRALTALEEKLSPVRMAIPSLGTKPDGDNPALSDVSYRVYSANERIRSCIFRIEALNREISL